MITIKDFMEVCDYRITEGSNYQWNCFGPNAYCLDSWNGDQNGHTISIIFDTVDQTVYQVMAYDYKNERAYRMTNPAYQSEFDNECEDRDVLDMAWEKDDGTPVKYVDLDVDDEWIQKAVAIVNGEEYDTRVQVPLTLSDESLFQLMKLAHEADMTLNQYTEQLLRQYIEDHKIVDELDTLRDEYDFSEGVRGSPAKITGKRKKDKK